MRVCEEVVEEEVAVRGVDGGEGLVEGEADLTGWDGGGCVWREDSIFREVGARDGV